MLLTSYFFVLGIFALAHMVSPLILKMIPGAVPKVPFHLKFTQGEGEELEVIMDYNFNTHDLVNVWLFVIYFISWFTFLDFF